MGKLTDYTDVTMLNESATLAQYDGQMYVKKILDTGAADIYKKLIGKRCNNVSEVLEIYEYKDRTIIIEEYINGTTLQKMITAAGRIDEKRVKDIIVQICDGLEFLHSLGIVHRDINPNNIIITRDGVVKIIDFDISRFVKEDAVADTKILGTVGYAAPEQFGFRQSDKRVDIYAVGVLMNVMLTGKMPNINRYGGKLGKIIKKATHIDVDFRYKNIKALKSAITGIIADDAPRAVKIIRSIPGFRTRTPWKTIIAIWLYITYLPLIFVWPYHFAKDIDSTFRVILGIVFILIIPFVFISNLFDIQNKISKRKSNATAISILISVISFIFGVAMIVPIFI